MVLILAYLPLSAVSIKLLVEFIFKVLLVKFFCADLAGLKSFVPSTLVI